MAQKGLYAPFGFTCSQCGAYAEKVFLEYPEDPLCDDCLSDEVIDTARPFYPAPPEDFEDD
jgi:hypothetical protein